MYHLAKDHDREICNSTSGLRHSQGSESKSEGEIAEDIEA